MSLAGKKLTLHAGKIYMIFSCPLIFCTVLPAKSDSCITFCLQSYQGLTIQGRVHTVSSNVECTVQSNV